MWWRQNWVVVLMAILVLPVLCTMVFARWLRRRPDLSVEDAVKCWDVFVKLVSAFTIIVTGAMLFGKYIDQQAQRDRYEAAFRRGEVLKQKLKFDDEQHKKAQLLFGEIKKVAAALARPDQRDEATRRRFEEMYHGDLIGVEQAAGPVERAMVRFRRALEAHERKALESGGDSDLGQLSLQLSQACEEELRALREALMRQHQEIADLTVLSSP